MGTNYYVYSKPACPACGREYPPKHIGKSSAGWCFSLHIYPDEGIKNWDDWKSYLLQGGMYILDEYGRDVPIAEMTTIITKRYRPQGLKRHKIDDEFCVGHAEGTYDYLVGEFS